MLLSEVVVYSTYDVPSVFLTALGTLLEPLPTARTAGEPIFPTLQVPICHKCFKFGVWLG